MIRNSIKKIAGPMCLIIMVIEIVYGIIDNSVQGFLVAFLAGWIGYVYIMENKKEK